jgi:hypothetical protein
MKKSVMPIDQELISLSQAELVTLVRQLRRQLAERDQEIAQLQRHLRDAPSVPQDTAASHDLSPSKEDASPPGSQEDLFALLEKIYPETREP